MSREMNYKNEGDKKKTSLLAFVLLFAVFLLLTIFIVFEDFDYLFGEAEEFTKMVDRNGEPEKTEFVKVNVQEIVGWGWYAETEHKMGGIFPMGTDKHCIIKLEDGSVISLTVKGKKNVKKINRIIDENVLYRNGDSDTLPKAVNFEGRIITTSPELDQYYRSTLNNAEVSELDGTKIFTYITIDTTDTRTWIVIKFVGCLLIAIVMGSGVVQGLKKRKMNN